MSTALSVFMAEVTPDVIGCPDPLVQREMLTVLQEFCAQTWMINKGFKKDVLATDPASPNNHIDITTPTDMAKWVPCGIMRLVVQGVEYTPKRREVADDLEPDIETFVEERLVKYWYPSTATNIIMYPFEAQALQLFLRVAFKPLNTLLTSDTFDDTFYQDWHDTIVAGTKARLLALPKKVWTDQNKAADYGEKYRQGKLGAVITVANSLDTANRRKVAQYRI